MGNVQVLKDPTMPLISSVFFMCLPDKVLVYGDCAVNVAPDPQQLAYIAVASAETAAAFGIEPRVAMLSYSTLGSGRCRAFRPGLCEFLAHCEFLSLSLCGLAQMLKRRVRRVGCGDW